MILRRSLLSAGRSLPRAEVSLCQPFRLLQPFSTATSPNQPGYWDDDDLDIVPPRPGSEDMQGYTAIGKVTKEAKDAWDKMYKQKGTHKYKRSKYAFEKIYKRGKMKEMFELSQKSFLLCFQHNMDVETMTAFKEKIEDKTEMRVVVKPVIKNSLCRLVCQDDFDQRFAILAPLFHGPTSIIYGTCAENLFADLRTVLKEGDEKAIFMGGQVDGAVVDHEHIDMLQKVESPVHLRSELIQSLQQPVHNLIRVVKWPQDNLVKSLDFQVKQSGGDPNDSADSAGSSDSSDSAGDTKAEAEATP